MEEEKIKETDTVEKTEVASEEIKEETVKSKKQTKDDEKNVEFHDHELTSVFDKVKNSNNQDLLQVYNMVSEHIEYLEKEKEKVLEDDKK